MKIFGSFLIILSTSFFSLIFVKSIKDKISLCDDFLMFCESLKVAISYSKVPIKAVIENSKINSYVDLEKMKISSFPFSKAECVKFDDFISSLGKADKNTELAKIESFKEFLLVTKDKYLSSYNSKSKVYLTLGIGSGILMTIMLI